MRYRPLGRAGASISNLTLSVGSEALSRGPGAARELIFTALEAGVNAYRLENADPVLAEVVGDALSHVDRKLVSVGVTLGLGDGRRGQRDFSAEGMTGAIDRALHVSGLGWIDFALLEEPGEHELPQSSLNALKALRATERVRLLGVSGDGDVMDAYVSTGAFDILATPYNLNSTWPVRHRIRAAREQDMAVFASDYFPASLATDKKAASAHEPKKGLFGFGAKKPASSLAGAGTYAFLHRTPGWSGEAICLAYALTDPSISSVLVSAHQADRLADLAAVPERDMPPGLAAQIEMARVGSGQAA
jgi:aryl-alcohol dehydrogenase-like predicted oxidoreductase